MSASKAVSLANRSPLRATPASGARTLWEHSLRKSSLRPRSTEHQSIVPLTLLQRFEAAAGTQWPPTSCLAQDLIRRAESVESLLKAENLTASKKKKAKQLGTAIGNLKLSVGKLKDKKIVKITSLADDVKAWLEQSLALDKKIISNEVANKKRKEQLLELNAQVLNELTRLETLTSNHQRIESEIAQLMSASALEPQVDKTASVNALLDYELKYKAETEAKIQSLIAERRVFEKKIRDLKIVGQEVNCFY